MKSDAEIQQAANYELQWDTRVTPEHIGVFVEHGIVTLSGHVTSWVERRAAAEAAHRVAGVRDVANNIEVRLPGDTRRSDSDLAAAVRSALEWDTTVPDQRITSTVSDGVVTLSGDVADWSNREDAEHAVERLTGVRAVVNSVRVAPEQAAVHNLKVAITAALGRQASREAASIDVVVADGHVTVEGAVRSYREKEAVLGAVRGTHGVRVVESRLRIDPFTRHPAA